MATDMRITVVKDENRKPRVESSAGEQPSTSSAKSDAAQSGMAKNMVAFHVVFNSAQSIASTAVGSIGEVTGNRPLQRKVDNTINLISTAAFVVMNPAFGVANLATQIGTQTINRAVRSRNEAINAEYYKKLYSSKYNNSRR